MAAVSNRQGSIIHYHHRMFAASPCNQHCRRYANGRPCIAWLRKPDQMAPPDASSWNGRAQEARYIRRRLLAAFSMFRGIDRVHDEAAFSQDCCHQPCACARRGVHTSVSDWSGEVGMADSICSTACDTEVRRPRKRSQVERSWRILPLPSRHGK